MACPDRSHVYTVNTPASWNLCSVGLWCSQLNIHAMSQVCVEIYYNGKISGKKALV